MIRPMRLVKWGLLIIGICWAIYSASAFIFLARTFPFPELVKHGASELFASIQGYAVVFGPVILAVLLLMIRWPEGGKGNSKGSASN